MNTPFYSVSFSSLLALASLAFISRSLAQVVPSPTVPPSLLPAETTRITQTTTIQLGTEFVMMPSVVAPPPQPPTGPVTVPLGSRLQLIAPASGPSPRTAVWIKDETPLPSTDTALVFEAVSSNVSGRYYAQVKSADGQIHRSATVIVFVTRQSTQRVINTSARTRIDASQPVFISGFVVEPGPDNALLLVRVAGPALATFGVSGVLAAPQLRIFDAQNREITPYPLWLGTSMSEIAFRVGAFPFPTASKDVAQLYYLRAGAYTAQISSADAGTGNALFEVYQIPVL